MKNYPDYKVSRIYSLKKLFLNTTKKYRSSIVFETTEKRFTYGQFEEMVLRVCSPLVKISNKLIALNISDPIMWAVAYWATILSGNVAVLSSCELLNENNIVQDIFMELNGENIKTYLECAPISYSNLPEENVCGPCTILFSSGTTGISKGVMLSQKNICANIVAGLEKYLMTEKDRFYNIIPYSHAFGLVCDLLAPLYVGATICFPDDKSLFFSQMALFKPTILNVPPIIASTLLKLIDSIKRSDQITGGKLKKILCGGAGLSQKDACGLRKYSINAYGCYGLSECSPCVSVNRDEYYKDGSAGVVLNCNQVNIAPDGEILVSGDNIMLGYYKEPQITSEVLQDGVLHTGDLGYMEGGFLYVLGRNSNLIIFPDGTKFSPEAMENDILVNTQAREVIVSKSEDESRVSLNILIHITNSDDEIKIREYINNIFVPYPISRVTFTNQELSKTATGKILR